MTGKEIYPINKWLDTISTHIKGSSHVVWLPKHFGSTKYAKSESIASMAPVFNSQSWN